MIRVLPTGHPAQLLDLKVPAMDADGQTTTLLELERRASEAPTFENVRVLYLGLDEAYRGWQWGEW